MERWGGWAFSAAVAVARNADSDTTMNFTTYIETEAYVGSILFFRRLRLIDRRPLVVASSRLANDLGEWSDLDKHAEHTRRTSSLPLPFCYICRY